MATYYLCPLASIFQYFTDTGVVLSGGKINTYLAGTSTPQATYTDITGGTPNANPIILNSNGRLPNVSIWVPGGTALKIIVTDSSNNQLGPTFDQIPGINDPAFISIGQALWPRTPAEIAAGVTPTSYAYEPLDARRYGFSESASAATNTTAITNALSVAAAQTFGGLVLLPAGNFNVNAFTVPQYVLVQGSGVFVTRLNWASSGTFVTLGGTGASLYNGGISDCTIIMSNATGEAVRAKGTSNARIERMYIEGPINTAGSIGVTIDGANASSFQNHVRDVNCNHINTGFRMITSGTVVCTQTLFENCYALGDGRADSTGFYIDSSQGNGTNWIGGNLEDCGIGIHIASNCSAHGIVLGARFEANTTDIQIESFADPWTFFGCVNLNPAKVINNAGTGYESQSFIGCTDSTTIPFLSTFSGQNRFRATKTGDIPLYTVAYPSDTGDQFQIRDSSNTVYFSINAFGAVSKLNQRALALVSTSGNPEGNITATPGSFAYDVGGAAWIKVTGSGNTGWKAVTHA